MSSPTAALAGTLLVAVLWVSPPLSAETVQPAANPAQLAEPTGVLCVTASSLLDAAPVTQTKCGRRLGLATGQIWDFRAAPDGSFQIVNQMSGKCLEVSADEKPDLAIQGTCRTKDLNRQLWELRSSGGPPSVVRLVSRAGGKCLEVPGSSGELGRQLILNRCKTAAPGWVDQFYVIAQLPPVK